MKRSIIFLAFFLTTILIGCGDPAPTDYVPAHIVQGYMIVGEPIRNVVVMVSQSVIDTFHYPNSAVADADVRIDAGGKMLQLEYRTNDGVGEYFYPDTTELVKPNTYYKLTVTLKDGTTMTGETTTPGQVSWTQAPKDTVQYPQKDSLNVVLPDSLKLIWTPVDGVDEFPISVRSLDTVEYGKYLSVETGEKNSRIDRELDKNDPRYADVSRWGFLQGTSTPISWFAFKWYGLHEVTIWAADRNFLNWYKFLQFGSNQQYDSHQGSITGGLGVFGSASVARKITFVLKNPK